MNTNRRVGTVLAALVAVVACGQIACTTQEAKPTSDAGTGTGGRGGSTGTGSGGSAYATNDGVLCPLPGQALITSFTYTGDAGTAPSVPFSTGATGFSGDEFSYPPATSTYPVTSDVTGNNWHMHGTLGDYSGFGLSFDNCTRLDASAYRGISFTVSGSVPQGNMITMGIGTLDDRIAASWLIAHPAPGTTPALTDPGRCVPASPTATNQYNQSECGDNTKVIPVTSTPTTQTILWADFTAGKPKAVIPTDITNIYWFFPPPTGAGTATPTTYDMDLVIDDLSFVP